jgi:acid stress-induced BolA-like protein IbaG/YrbA
MHKLTLSNLQKILSKNLSLKNPIFHFQRYGERINGSVISDSFKGKVDSERQQMIWDALDHALGAESVKLVGMLLAYTPGEWEADAQVARRNAKTA